MGNTHLSNSVETKLNKSLFGDMSDELFFSIARGTLLFSPFHRRRIPHTSFSLSTIEIFFISTAASAGRTSTRATSA